MSVKVLSPERLEYLKDHGTTAEFLAEFDGPIVLADGTQEQRRHRLTPRWFYLRMTTDSIDVTPCPPTPDMHRHRLAGDRHVHLCLPLPVAVFDWWASVKGLFTRKVLQP